MRKINEREVGMIFIIVVTLLMSCFVLTACGDDGKEIQVVEVPVEKKIYLADIQDFDFECSQPQPGFYICDSNDPEDPRTLTFKITPYQTGWPTHWVYGFQGSLELSEK